MKTYLRQITLLCAYALALCVRGADGIPQGTVYFTAGTDRTTLYEGQAAVVRYDIHLRTGVTVTGEGLTLSHKPDAHGFVVKEFPIKSIQAKSETGGLTGLVMKSLVMPQQAGSLTLPGVTFECPVLLHTVSGNDPFTSFFNARRAVVERTTPSVRFDVRPLPSPRPDGFTGGVGRFSLQVVPPKDRLRVGETATLRIVLSGTGNLPMLSAPQWKQSPDFSFGTPNTSDSTRLTDTGLTGRMVYDYPLTPRRSGRLQLPALAFAFFNPATARYEMLHSETTVLDVEEAASVPDAVTDKENDHVPPLVFSAVMKTVVVVALLLVGLYLYFLRHKKQKAVSKPRRNAAEEALWLLDQKETLSAVRDALETYVRMTVDGDLPPREQIVEQLTACGVEQEQAERVAMLLRRVDAAMFAPELTEDDADNLLSEARKLFHTVG